MSQVLEGWVRMGVMAEKRILLDGRDLFHGLVVPAHVLAMYEMSFAQFLPEIQKPYFIDPMTYIFFQSSITRRNGEDFRKSYEKMFRSCPDAVDLISRNLTHSSQIKSSDFDEVAATIARCALSAQSLNHTRLKAKKSLERLKKHRKRKTALVMPDPSFLVGPYVYFRENDKNYKLWKQSSEVFRNLASSRFPGIPEYDGLCIDVTVLSNRHLLNRIIKDLIVVDGIVIWVSDFEKRATLESMRGLKYLIESMKLKGVHKIYSLYGGYVTAQFHHYGLNGLSYGLTYGDSKPVSQQSAGGGGAPLRYYEPAFHQFQPPRAISAFYSFYPEAFQCQCSVCSKTSSMIEGASASSEIIADFFPLGADAKLTWHLTRRHFLEVRSSELQKIPSSKISVEAKKAKAMLQKHQARSPKLRIKTDYIELISKMDML